MRFRSLAGVLVLFVAGCASNTGMQYSSEKMLDSGYDQYKTYAFLPTNDTNYARLVNRQQLVPLLITTGKDALEQKGFVLDTVNPDCLFTYHLVVNRKYEANQQSETVYNPQTYNAATVPMYYDAGPGVSAGTAVRAGTAPYSGVYYFSSNNRPYTYNGKMHIDTLREGSMVIDMIDAKTNNIVWRSVAEGRSAEANLPTLNQAVNTIIPKMLRKLPHK